jgi:hypothetical protein
VFGICIDSFKASEATSSIIFPIVSMASGVRDCLNLLQGGILI